MNINGSAERSSAARSKLELLYADVLGEVHQLVGRVEAAQVSLTSGGDEARRLAGELHDHAVELRSVFAQVRSRAAADQAEMQQALLAALATAAKRQPMNVRQLVGALLMSFIGSSAGVIAVALLLSR
ncbi:hypothetical protein [Achromobacter ruhlandii]|uniref:hypothetical protein n=1 Tax=Achromobacter ruhlandii TaxID=72557 RepID=UPI003B9FF778